MEKSVLKFLDYLLPLDLSEGLGTEKSPCSIAAMNLFLTGTLTDKIPDCASLVAGRWVILIQGVTPGTIRNSTEWKTALAQLPGTGRDKERERLEIILDWMWDIVLPQLCPVAERGGFSGVWNQMLRLKTVDSAYPAARAARAADAAARAAYAAGRAAYAYTAASGAASCAEAASSASRAASYASDASGADFWPKADPASLLRKLVEASL